MKANKKTIIGILAGGFTLFLLILYWERFTDLVLAFLSAANPLIIGAVTAYIVNILMSFYERHFFPRSQKRFVTAIRRPFCITAAFFTLIAVIMLVVLLIVPQLTSCIKVIIDIVPPALEKAEAWIQQQEYLPDNLLDLIPDIDWKALLTGFGNYLSAGVTGVVNTMAKVVSSVLNVIVTALISTIFSIYLLSGKGTISRQIHRIMRSYIRPSIIEKIDYALGVFNDCFRRYIVGQCTEAVILGMLCTIGMLILQLPYATMIGALVAFTALIPIAGAYIGAIVGAFMILTVSPIKALIFLIFLIVLQQLEGNIIYPRVVGSSLGLPGIWVLAAITVGGGVMGVTGMVIAVPITAAAYRMLRDNVNKRETAMAACDKTTK